MTPVAVNRESDANILSYVTWMYIIAYDGGATSAATLWLKEPDGSGTTRVYGDQETHERGRYTP